MLNIEDILYMLPRIENISHIGGKVVPELGENGLSSPLGYLVITLSPSLSHYGFSPQPLRLKPGAEKNCNKGVEMKRVFRGEMREGTNNKITPLTP